MYIFVSKPTESSVHNVVPIDTDIFDVFRKQRGMCNIMQHNATQKEEIEKLLLKIRSHFPRRSLHIIFQPRLQYITNRNKIDYCKSFIAADTMLITDAFGKEKKELPRIRDIIAHMKYYSKLKSAKRAYNYRDIISYIKNDIPQDGLVVFVGFKNTQSILKEVTR